jgi:hypothetical protein
MYKYTPSFNAGLLTVLLGFPFGGMLKGDVANETNTVSHRPTALCDPFSLPVPVNAL